jgi:hypothetical protein
MWLCEDCENKSQSGEVYVDEEEEDEARWGQN